MLKTLYVSALLVLYVKLGHSFSWDIVVSRANRLEFYNEGTLIYNVTVTEVTIEWITYDPLHNRVLFAEKYNFHDFVSSFEVETKRIQSIIRYEPQLHISRFVYDTANELFYGTIGKSIYSFLMQPGCKNIEQGSLVLDLEHETMPSDLAVDSCRGYIYWTTHNKSNIIERVRFDGSEREIILENGKSIMSGLTIDQETQKMYWIEKERKFSELYSIESADLNGTNRRTIYRGTGKFFDTKVLVLSKDVITWTSDEMIYFWQLPKNPKPNTDVTPNKILIPPQFPYGTGYWYYGPSDIAASYNVQDSCKTKNNMLQNRNDYQTAFAHEGLFCIHGTKFTGESRCECTQGYTGDTCDVSICQNYCFHGNCSANPEGQPTCSCNAGYSGERCEDNICYNYCLNDGDCYLNEEGEPTCACAEEYKGDRCEGVPAFCLKHYHTISIIKDILDADLTSFSQDLYQG